MAMAMSSSGPRGFGNYRWIVPDSEMLGGKLAVRGTRLSVAFILSCLAESMSADEKEFGIESVTAQSRGALSK